MTAICPAGPPNESAAIRAQTSSASAKVTVWRLVGAGGAAICVGFDIAEFLLRSPYGTVSTFKMFF